MIIESRKLYHYNTFCNGIFVAISMSEIFSQEIGPRELLLADTQKAKAIGDPVRSLILQVLSRREASIAEIQEELGKEGIELAPTTVRHHVDILKKAGLVQLTRLVDSKGGVLKYYGSNLRVMHHNPPENFEEELGVAIEEAGKETEGLLRKIMERHGEKVKEVAMSLKPCPHCSDEHFMEYVLAQILNRGTAEAMQGEELKSLLKGEGG